MKQMSEELNDIKRLLAKSAHPPTFAQVAATEPPMHHHGTATSHRKPHAGKDETKKRHREELTVKINSSNCPGRH